MATYTTRGDSIQVKIRKYAFKPISGTFSTQNEAESWANLVEYYLDSVASESQTIETLLGISERKLKEQLYVALLSSESYGKDVHRLTFTFLNPNELAISYSAVSLVPYPVVCSFYLPLLNPADQYKQITDDLAQFKVGKFPFYKVPLKQFIRYLKSTVATET